MIATGPTTRALLPFFLITFGLAWGLFAVLVGLPGPVTRIFGPVSAHNPLFILSVYAPAISALILVGLAAGTAGLAAYLRRLLIWRLPAAWLGFILFVIPAVYFTGATFNGTLSAFTLPGSFGTYAATALFMLILGPVEEIGWRGFALPLLQRLMAPLWAGILLGLIWGLWHLPAFFASGTPQSNWDFLPFLAGSVAVSVILVPIFNAARGSILWAALYHFQLNNPLWPDAQPWDMYLFVALALVVVWLNRSTMMARAGAVTEVFAPAA